MQARTIAETRSPNPAFDHAEYQRCVAAGRLYEVPPIVVHQPGRLLDDRQAWMLCVPGHMNSKPVAEPVDDECRKMVERWLSQRGARLAVVAAAVAAKDAGRITDPAAARNIEALAEAYREELPERKKKGKA